MTLATRSLGCAAAVLYAIFIARTAFRYEGGLGFSLFDDALISMRYGRNLAAGGGLVWNVGEPPVEGFTNPLWTFWMAAIHYAGAGDRLAPLAVAITGAVLLIGTAWITFRVTKVLTEVPGEDDLAPVIAAALVLFSYPLMFWTLRGMEVGLLAFCLTAAVYQLLKIARGAGPDALILLAIALMAAVFTRRDAALVALPLGIHAAACLAAPVRVRALAVILGTTVAALVAQTLFSMWYFGDPLPNTYYLKMSGTPAVERLGRGVATAAIQFGRTLAAPAILAALAIARTPTAARHPLLLLAAVVSLQVAYSVQAGGDAWEYMGYSNRYMAVALPCLCILAAIGITRLLSSAPPVSRGIAAVLAALAGVRMIVELVLHWANRAVPRHASLFSTDPALFTAVAMSIVGVSGVAAVAVWRGRISLPGSRVPAIVVLAALVWAMTDGMATAQWVWRNADSVKNDIRLAKAGLAIRETTPADTVLAVTSAGALPYFSRRRSIDILGKMDPAVARMPAVGPFHPGHDKWDLDRSIASAGPDLVAGLPKAAGQIRYLLDLHYEPWHGTFFAKHGSAARMGDLQGRLSRLYHDVPPHPEAR